MDIYITTIPKAHVELPYCQEIIDFVATEIAKFGSAHPENEDGASLKKMKLGFTLSYPVDQTVPFTGTTFQNKSADDPVEYISPFTFCNNAHTYLILHIYIYIYIRKEFTYVS